MNDSKPNRDGKSLPRPAAERPLCPRDERDLEVFAVHLAGWLLTRDARSSARPALR